MRKLSLMAVKLLALTFVMPAAAISTISNTVTSAACIGMTTPPIACLGSLKVGSSFLKASSKASHSNCMPHRRSSWVRCSAGNVLTVRAAFGAPISRKARATANRRLLAVSVYTD